MAKSELKRKIETCQDGRLKGKNPDFKVRLSVSPFTFFDYFKFLKFLLTTTALILLVFSLSCKARKVEPGKEEISEAVKPRFR